MRRLKHVPVGAMNPLRFRPLISPAAYASLLALIGDAAGDLDGRVIWNVNSTSRGGGVVELLRTLLGYARGSGVDARWVVVRAEPEFFALTKRLHNHLHGFDGAGAIDGCADRSVYERTLAAAASELVPLVRAHDVVILHDPQTAGLVEAVKGTGAAVIWRCHVGLDRANAQARQAWAFLRPYVEPADAYVFSRPTFAWEGLPTERISVIQPSIDAFSPKNATQDPQETMAILARAAIVPGAGGGLPTFRRADGTPGRVDRRAALLEEAPITTADRLVTQVSRWDRLKDPAGVMLGFAESVPDRLGAHLLLAGPSVDSVADDPEGAAVYAEVASAWSRLPPRARRRVHLATLPMADVDENAAIVNAIQRHSEVVVQKSLAEGFGLTVAEAMWKQRAVLASRIGGIQDQIVDGESGVLLDDPLDLAAYGSALSDLLSAPLRARRLGISAQERVRAEFLAPAHLSRYFELIRRLRRPAAVG